MADETLRNLTDIPGFDSRPSIDPESASELDRLVADKLKDKTEATPEPEPEDRSKATPEPEPEDKSKATPEPEPEDKAEPDDEFSKVQLPPYTKPKTSESFETVKRLAREKISALESEKSELLKKTKELEAKASSALSPEVEKELKELREFRNRLDVQASPEFLQFDTKVEANVEAIYSRLKEAGMSEKQINEIKSLGGPAEVDWDAISDKLPAPLRRFIESRLVENEGILGDKTKAIEEAKKNADQYLRAKQEEAQSSKAASANQTEKAIQELVPKLGWMEPRKPKDGASDAEKSVIAQHNKLVEESNQFLKEAAGDDSPEMRGTLALAYVQLQKLRMDYSLLKLAKDAQVSELTEELKATKAVLEKVKKSSTARLKTGHTPDASEVKPASLDTPGSEALDSLRKGLDK